MSEEYKNCYGEVIDLFGGKQKKTGKGYRDIPGSGPEGESCGTCGNRVTLKYANRYFKCGLIAWTNGVGTDIRLKSPACKFWKPMEKDK